MKLSRRTLELTTEKINEEIIVYDERTHQAHCLNKAASFIWTNCDGRTSLEEIADRMPAGLGLPADTAIVQMAAADLLKLGLLEGAWNEARSSSRRQMIRKLAYAGCAAGMLPAVTSIIAPTPAMARSADTHSIDGSGRPPGSPGGDTVPPDPGGSNAGGSSDPNPGGSGHGGNPGNSNQGGNSGHSNQGGNPGNSNQGGNPGHSNQGGNQGHSNQGGGNPGNSNPGRGPSGGNSGNSNPGNSNGGSGQNSGSSSRRTDHGPESSSRGSDRSGNENR